MNDERADAATYRWRIKWGRGEVSEWFPAGSPNEVFWARYPEAFERQCLYAARPTSPLCTFEDWAREEFRHFDHSQTEDGEYEAVQLEYARVGWNAALAALTASPASPLPPERS